MEWIESGLDFTQNYSQSILFTKSREKSFKDKPNNTKIYLKRKHTIEEIMMFVYLIESF